MENDYFITKLQYLVKQYSLLTRVVKQTPQEHKQHGINVI